MVAQFIAALLYLGVTHGELAHDPFVREAAWKLLEDAHYGFAATEEAMFVIRGADGQLTFLRWNGTGIAHHAQWNGAMPAGVIAIVHTHPNTTPRPSHTDVRTAIESQVPVYVVTRSRVTKTFGGTVSIVAKGNWR